MTAPERLRQQLRNAPPPAPERINGEWSCVCGHDPCDGLDCGVFLPGQKPRKQVAPKTAETMAEIRARAWATRRAKYGERGHR